MHPLDASSSALEDPDAYQDTTGKARRRKLASAHAKAPSTGDRDLGHLFSAPLVLEGMPGALARCTQPHIPLLLLVSSAAPAIQHSGRANRAHVLRAQGAIAGAEARLLLGGRVLVRGGSTTGKV